MKKFKDLVFQKHPSYPSFDKNASLHFKNGYGVSVTSGTSAYTDEKNPYEVAVLKGNRLCYDTPITSDVIGYQDKKGVTKIMKKIQKLEA